MRTFNLFDQKFKRRMAENRSQLGFTLIEVMVVIAIIGIMATLIVPQIMSKPDEARVIAARGELRLARAAVARLGQRHLGRLGHVRDREHGLAAAARIAVPRPLCVVGCWVFISSFWISGT